MRVPSCVSHASTAFSKHRVGVEPLFCLFSSGLRPCLRRGEGGNIGQEWNCDGDEDRVKAGTGWSCAAGPRVKGLLRPFAGTTASSAEHEMLFPQLLGLRFGAGGMVFQGCRPSLPHPLPHVTAMHLHRHGRPGLDGAEIC